MLVFMRKKGFSVLCLPSCPLLPLLISILALCSPQSSHLIHRSLQRRCVIVLLERLLEQRPKESNRQSQGVIGTESNPCLTLEDLDTDCSCEIDSSVTTLQQHVQWVTHNLTDRCDD